MLVISRKTSEEICIGDNIRVMVVRIKCGQVKLGIKAPKEIRADRSEIHERRKKNGEAA